jgi:hypothetical protein
MQSDEVKEDHEKKRKPIGYGKMGKKKLNTKNFFHANKKIGKIFVLIFI